MGLRQLYRWCLFNSGIQLHILALCPLPKDDGWKQGLWGKEEGGGGLRAVVIAVGGGAPSLPSPSQESVKSMPLSPCHRPRHARTESMVIGSFGGHTAKKW